MAELSFESPIGPLTIIEKDGFITNLSFSKCEKSSTSDILILAKSQLKEYFCGKRQVFQLPLNPNGTSFQHDVWNQLLEIPYGETRTYQEIARKIGNEKASRAVGMANHKNPIPILIPCHRVIGVKGALTGYAGGLERKIFLLQLEKRETTEHL